MNIEEHNWSTYLPIPFVVLDQNMDLVDASRAAFSLFRIRYREMQKAEGLAELSDYLLNRMSFVSAIGEATLRLSNLGSRDRVRWIDGDRIFDIDISSMPPKEEPVFGLHFKDITKRINLEHEQEHFRNYLEQMIDSLPLGIVVVDNSMTITAMNRVQEEYMLINDNPVSRLTAIGSRICDIMPDHEYNSWDRGQTKATYENEYTITDGEKIRTFSTDVIPLLDENREVIGAMHITEEITEHLQLLAEAHEAEVLAARFETLQQTATTLNHNINNKLMGIMCSIQVVRSGEHALPEKKLKLLEEAMDETEIIAQFIRDLANVKEIKTVDYHKAEKMLNIPIE